MRTSQQMRDLVENFYGGIYLMEDESLFGQTVLSLLSPHFLMWTGGRISILRCAKSCCPLILRLWI